MKEIIDIGLNGKEMKLMEQPAITFTMNRDAPARAQELLVKAHNYLIYRQNDGAAWKSDRPDQLAGKGERSLEKVLGKWQKLTAETEAEVVTKMFSTDEHTDMNKLFDTLGRGPADVADVVGRARRELRVHNPTAFVAHEEIIEAWLESRKPAAAAAEEEEAEAAE